ncbi:MAG: restriction endonuclease [Chloroflexaceae bacterium]|jgi:hypothetical protein|nr:restriction endonuclease [Chloroflexaceae bacterium]
MSVDVQQDDKRGPSKVAKIEEPAAPRPPLMQRLQTGLSQIEWGIMLITALVMALGWCVLFLSPNILQILAGIVPVLAGLFLGRKVKNQLLLHGVLLGVIGFLMGLGLVALYGALSSAGLVPMPQFVTTPNQPPTSLDPAALIYVYVTFSMFALIPFPAFGTVMAGRSEQRNRELRQYVEERGGRLERPTAVRTLEDLQGLSLPQLGYYVNSLFKKNGFEFVDYHFIDKDKHLELELKYKEEVYLARLSVADKVRPGTVEGLVQEMKRRGVPKGIVITSTEFTPEALKSINSRRHLLPIDGSTLFEIAEK